MIVLTDEDDRQVPQSGHVERLKDLSLIGSTVAVPALMS